MTDFASLARQTKTKEGRSRVLLVMPPDVASAYQPHLGLGILANSLRRDGHVALVLDYSYLESRTTSLPKIEEVLAAFHPDVIGVSLFSQHLHLSRRFVENLHRLQPATPIVVGGPHVSLAAENSVTEVLSWPGVRTIVRGEAEADIANIINGMIEERVGGIVNCKPVEMTEYCRPDFELFADGTELETYPIQLSRGCPYECVFCNIDRLSGRRFRKRDIGDCIDEIREASSRYKRLRYIKVTDDAPNCDSGRFEGFIEQYIANGFRAQLEVMQLRADHLTLKSCQLLKKAGQPFICIGVESADHTVLAGVQKGEKLEHIERACGYVKSVGLPLVLCFVLGLPEASKKTDYVSIGFARKMGPVHCYWNIAQPMSGTKMYDYFLSKGRIYSKNAFAESSLQGGCFADTVDYPREERLRMQVIAQATTNELTKQSVAELLRRGATLGVLPAVLWAMLSKRPQISKKVSRRW